MSVFKGAGVAIVTPFHEDDCRTNYEVLKELIDFQIDNGTDAIIICGTTGESSTMTEEEHLECIRFTCDYVNKRVPVIAGTGSNSTETAIYLSQEADKAGADACLLVTPYYNKATQGGLYQHYAAVASKINVPIIMYNVPSRTGLNIQPATVAKIVKEIDNVVGVKEASGDIAQVAKIMQLTNGEAELYSGNDDQIIPLLSLGGQGVISVLSNVAPRETHEICQKWFDGDVVGARELQLKMIPLADQLFTEVNPIPVKRAVELMGYKVGPLRLPLTKLEAAHEETLVAEMKKLGII